MPDIEQITAFFGWCSVINIGVLVFTTLFLILAKGLVSGVHAKLFGLEEKNLSGIYFTYLANYKIAILMFNIVPYIALKLIN